MPRQKRVDEASMIYHAINRGNALNAIFHNQMIMKLSCESLPKGSENMG